MQEYYFEMVIVFFSTIAKDLSLMTHYKGHSTLPHGSGDQLIYHLERLIHLTQHLNTTSATHVTGNNQEPMIPPELWPKNCHGDRIDIKLNKGPTYEAVIVLVRSL